ncbi:MAG: polysaccharide ABC transporter ATP-binding protein [bacterium]
MPTPIIRVMNIGKKYVLGATLRHDTLREQLMGSIKFFLHPFQGNNNPYKAKSISKTSSLSNNEFWALKDVSFNVNQGEVLGIIGRNGAGKSTLLKILSQITDPTEGMIRIRGRVSSLLEVGTGFHPELTGRENIYLNGAILGMTRVEIKKKFDEIVAFSGVEKFIDTPIKRYSSGMNVRLAFAVAAHLEPELLLVDEVLAVGDFQFQKKCLGKMKDISGEGRTVLFVSHNLASISNLCSQAMWLEEGKLKKRGPVKDVIEGYTEQKKGNYGEQLWKDASIAPGNDKIRLRSVRIISDGAVRSDVDIQKDIYIEIEFWNFKPGSRITTFIHILDKWNVCVLASANMRSINLGHDEWSNQPHPAGIFQTTCILPGNLLNVGFYTLNIYIQTDIKRPQVIAQGVISFMVNDNEGCCKEYSGIMAGVIRPKLKWSTKNICFLDEQ